MKKKFNRLCCALILLCTFGIFTGCQQETNDHETNDHETTITTTISEKENPMKKWVVGNWWEAELDRYANYTSDGTGWRLEIKNDGTWTNIYTARYSDYVTLVEEHGTWECKADNIVSFIRDDGYVALGTFTSDTYKNEDLLMLNSYIYLRQESNSGSDSSSSGSPSYSDGN